MSLNINKNFGAIANNAATSMGLRQSAMGKAISRISTGKRVNGPSDDPTAYMASRRIEADSAGYTTLANGIQTASTKLNAIDSGISSVLDVLNAMKAKALEYNAADDATAQAALNNDFKNLAKVLDSALNFKYNGKSVMAQSNDVGAYATIYSDTQIANNLTSFSNFKISGSIGSIKDKITGAMDTNKDGLESTGITNADKIVGELTAAIDEVVKEQASVASVMGALEYANAFLQNAATAQDAAYSSITEVDMAREMTTYVKNNVLSQASQAMISQANQSMAQVLNLLQ